MSCTCEGKAYPLPSMGARVRSHATNYDGVTGQVVGYGTVTVDWPGRNKDRPYVYPVVLVDIDNGDGTPVAWATHYEVIGK